MTTREELTVRHQAGDCRVVAGRGLLEEAPQQIRALSIGGSRGNCAVVTDANVAALYLEPLLAGLRATGMRPLPVVVPAGEASKSMEAVAGIIDQLAGARLDRHSSIIALGGGVIGDLAGFVAAIYYRGIPHVQIPTTVISQCDSAIGGKTGVNTVNAKNLIGAFHPARLVIVDPDTLVSLPKREFNEGFAEVVKHGVIRDPALLDTLAELDDRNLLAVIWRNLQIKAEIVDADEFERNGLRATLNFGHTIGHGIEQAAGYGRLLHGEAISLGIVAASRISRRKLGLPAEEFNLILRNLDRFTLPTSLPVDITTEAVLESLLLDKKFHEGQIRFVLTPRIGQAVLSEPGFVTMEDLRTAVEELRTPVPAAPAR